RAGPGPWAVGGRGAAPARRPGPDRGPGVGGAADGPQRLRRGGAAVSASGGSGRAAWLFLAPFLAVFAVFTLYPLGLSGVLAMQRTHGPGHSIFVGLQNFRGLL